ncbi:MAG TPA: DUF6188 family protein [Acidimicrobiales bacterium]|nr:DUF6188 family protein [Acidimicrobiales bacterium]
MAELTTGFDDRGDHHRVPVEGALVDRVCVDFAVTLQLRGESGEWQVQIESPFVMTSSEGDERLVVPELGAKLAVVLDVLRVEVSEARARKDGSLHVAFADGTHVDVAPDEGYEAWNVTGPGGARIVALPGGELAVWSPTADADG